MVCPRVTVTIRGHTWHERTRTWRSRGDLAALGALGHHVVLEKQLRSQVRSIDSVECGMTEQEQLPPMRQPELADPDAEIAGVPGKHLVDLWQWAYSDLVSNGIRGVVAEYLVGSALGCLRGPRPAWVGWDLDYGTARIEVKTAGDVQAWPPPKKLRTARFTIGAHWGWDPVKNEVALEPVRLADVFVFCHHHSHEDDWRQVIDTRQWSFHVVSTALLNRELPEQKTVSLPVVKRYCLAGEGRTTDFPGIKSAVDEILATGIEAPENPRR
jgi:hypothetical protein